MPRVLILLADYGHDPTKVAVPHSIFQNAGFDIDSDVVHRLLADYFPKTLRANSDEKKVVAAICHGVQVLAFTPDATSVAKKFPISASGEIDRTKNFKSVIHACKTTALPGFMESSIYQATRLFLGDYYKTYGGSTPSVQKYVEVGLDDPEEQFQPGPFWYNPRFGSPFIVEDETYRYVSSRFPPDAEVFAKKAVELVKDAQT